MAHSRLLSEEISEFYPEDLAKTKVLYPPVDLSIFKIASGENGSESLHQKFNIPKENLLFLFVSSSHKRKGFPLLEDFFEKTTLPVTLLVAGRELPRNDYKNIHYLGYLNDIEKAYSSVDFSILASKYEPFGLAAIESVAVGKPVVISNMLGAAEVINDNVKIEFDPANGDSLEKAIAAAVKNKGEMTKRALAEPSTKFLVDLSLKHHFDELMELCHKVKSSKA